MYKFKYIDRRITHDTPEALVIGSAYHEGLAAWRTSRGTLREAHSAVKASLEGWEDKTTAPKVCAMVTAYSRTYADDFSEYEVVSVEDEVRFQVHGRNFISMIDAVYRDAQGDLWVVEEKSSGMPIYPGAPFWSKVPLDLQLDLYVGAAQKMLGSKPVGVIYSVANKPRLKFQPRGKEETLRQYYDRCVDWMDSQKLRRERHLTAERNLDEALSDVLAFIESIEKGVFPRNTGNCHKFHRPCDYYEVCSGKASIMDDTLYKIKERR